MKQCLDSVRCRYVFAFAGGAAVAITTGLNTHFFITVIYMGNHTAMNSTLGSSDGPFSYSVNTRNLLIGSYFWGYLITQIPGGRLSETLSAKWTVFASVVLSIACTALTPTFARMHIYGVFAVRILQGLSGGVSLPGLHTMIARWAPPNERSTMCSVVYSSGALGIAVSLVMSYSISTLLSWQYVFYIMASISAPLPIFWIFFVSDHPHQNAWMSDKEKGYLEVVLHTEKKTTGLPLKSILKSKPVWAVFAAHVCGCHTWYTLMFTLPLYIVQGFAFELRDAVLFTALAFFCAFLFGIMLGVFIDFVLIMKCKTSVGLGRNLGTWTAIFLPALCLILLGLDDVNSAGAVSLTTMATTFMGGMFSGYFIGHIDIAPNYAGTLMGLTNTFATIPAILLSALCEMLINYRPSLESWQLVYAPNICLLLISAMIHTAFGSSKEQEWNAVKSEEEEEEEKKN